MIPTVIKVQLSDDALSIVEVPITPNTTATDVIECCKEPGEVNCHLAELWRGRERCVTENEKPYTILQQWGSHAFEVRFCIRHDDNVIVNNTQALGQQRSTSEIFSSIHVTEDGQILSSNGFDMSLNDLKAIAQRQQQQIEQQQHTLVGKEQRLRFLKHQMQQQQTKVNDNEKLQQLRERAEIQEAKLRKIRSLRGKVDQKRYQNTSISTELEAVQTLFEEKQQELSVAMSKVQELTNQLDELRTSKTAFGSSALPISDACNQQTELDKLKQEMDILNRMNEEQQKRLLEQRHTLLKRNEDALDLDRRIEELTNRLHQKRLENSIGFGQSKASQAKMHTIVAAVEPLVKQLDPNVMDSKNFLTQNDQGISTNKHFAEKPRSGSIDYDRNTVLTRGQPEGYNPRYPDVKFQGAAEKSLNQTSFSDKAQFPKSDTVTATVQPMHTMNYSPSSDLADGIKSNKGGYYSLNSQTSTNLFAYKPPSLHNNSNSSKPNVSVLPSGNIKYNPSKNRNLPPPYPSTDKDSMHSQSIQNKNSDRPVTVDIEALRRKFAHAPRPLKKRSSITEPERPQGPNLPKLLYDQIYKKADTPFYRPHMESHRSTPPPAYVEPSYINSIPEKTTDVEHEVSNAFTSMFYGHTPDNQAEVAATISETRESSLTTYPRGILRRSNQAGRFPNRRIRFDPLALLLDASLEGEYDLVRKIISEVKDPSGANDEGITALHNAVCAGHLELVRFLVHYGSDINAADTDGWTPLHCAASCNNLTMARFLVENGACVFAATLSDGETAADKCEQLDEGYIPCSEYLYGIQEKLGAVRQGQVYALFDYNDNNSDELAFKDGDYITILRKGDEIEREWWWAQLGSNEGYVPRNLLGLWPRIKPREESKDLISA